VPKTHRLIEVKFDLLLQIVSNQVLPLILERVYKSEWWNFRHFLEAYLRMMCAIEVYGGAAEFICVTCIHCSQNVTFLKNSRTLIEA
jgi:uncharacterized membrane protein